MKVQTVDNDYYTIREDDSSNRFYIKLWGQWNYVQEQKRIMDKNVFNNVLSHAIERDNDYTLVFDMTLFDPENNDYFNMMLRRLGVRLAEVGLKAHAQVMPELYFLYIEPGPYPIIRPVDPDTGKPVGLFRTEQECDDWLDSL